MEQLLKVKMPEPKNPGGNRKVLPKPINLLLQPPQLNILTVCKMIFCNRLNPR